MHEEPLCGLKNQSQLLNFFGSLTFQMVELNSKIMLFNLNHFKFHLLHFLAFKYK